MAELKEERCLHFKPEITYKSENAADMVASLHELLNLTYVEEVIPWVSQDSNRLHALVVFTSLSAKCVHKSMDLAARGWKMYELNVGTEEILKSCLQKRSKIIETGQGTLIKDKTTDQGNTPASNLNTSAQESSGSLSSVFPIFSVSNYHQPATSQSQGESPQTARGYAPPSRSRETTREGLRGTEESLLSRISQTGTIRDGTSSKQCFESIDPQGSQVSFRSSSHNIIETKRRRNSPERELSQRTSKRPNTSTSLSIAPSADNHRRHSRSSSMLCEQTKDTRSLEAQGNTTKDCQEPRHSQHLRTKPWNNRTDSNCVVDEGHYSPDSTSRAKESKPGNSIPPTSIDMYRSSITQSKYIRERKQSRSPPNEDSKSYSDFGPGWKHEICGLRDSPRNDSDGATPSLRDRLGMGVNLDRFREDESFSTEILPPSMSSSRHRHSSNISGDTLLSRISYRSGSPVRNSITQLGSFPHSLTSSVDDNEVPVMTNDYLVPNEPPESIPRSILKGSSLAGVGTINSDSEPVFNPDCDGPNEVMLQASSDPALLARISGANTPPPPGNKAIGMRAQQHASVSDFKLASTSGIQPPPTAPVTSSAVSFSTFRFSSSFKNDIPKQSSRQTHSHHEVVNSPASTLLTRIEGIQKSKSSFTSSATGPPSPPTEGGQARSELRINSVQGAIPSSSNLFSRTEKLGPSDSSAMELKASSESERNGTPLITQKSGSAKPNARFEVTAVASGLSSVTYPPNPLLGQTLSTDTSIRSRLSQVETLLQRETEKNTMLQDLFKIENEKNAKLHELVTSLTGALAEERGKREAVENELRKIQDRNRSLEVSKDVLHKVKSLIEDATCQ